MRSARSWGAAVAVLSLTLAAGCGSSSNSSANRSATPTPSSSAASASFNAADVAFATAVDQLDNQAHRLAALVPGRTAHHDLNSLMTAIDQHHVDLTPLPAWAKAGATPRPQPSGLWPAATFRAMSTMHGAAFDDAWLEHMAGTYAAIVALCRQELAHGVNPQARALATQPGLLNRVRRYHESWMHDDGPGMPVNPGPRFSPGPHSSPGPHYSGMPHYSPGPHSEMPHASSSPHR